MQEGVASAMVALGEFLLSGVCPPAALQQACSAATKLLKGEAICQDVSSDADEWEEQEEKEVCQALLSDKLRPKTARL